MAWFSFFFFSFAFAYVCISFSGSAALTYNNYLESKLLLELLRSNALITLFNYIYNGVSLLVLFFWSNYVHYCLFNLLCLQSSQRFRSSGYSTQISRDFANMIRSWVMFIFFFFFFLRVLAYQFLVFVKGRLVILLLTLWPFYPYSVFVLAVSAKSTCLANTYQFLTRKTGGYF